MQEASATPTQPTAPFFAFFGNSTTAPPDPLRSGTCSVEPALPDATLANANAHITKPPSVAANEGERPLPSGCQTSLSSTSPEKPRNEKPAINPSQANGAVRSGGRPAVKIAIDKPSSVPPDSLRAATELQAHVLSPTSADVYSRMLDVRSTSTSANGYSVQMPPPPPPISVQTSESSAVHQHIHDMANKRISTLDYLRKAHSARVYWFNTLRFDKPDLTRMPYFDSRKLARRATNYLLFGISLPTVIDLNSSTPLEFLRSFNTLLSEFDSFQQLHSENGSSGSLSRARLPQMFRRGAVASSKGRRSSSAGGPGGAAANDTGHAPEPVDNGTSTGEPLPGAISFAASETDLLPGEEYTHLLTPSLPFDPDFFETFATLCDVLIDAYMRLLSLLPTPRECSGTVAELFTKADGRVRKIIIQGIVKEFEDSTRQGVKAEVANVGKVVLGGLM